MTRLEELELQRDEVICEIAIERATEKNRMLQRIKDMGKETQKSPVYFNNRQESPICFNNRQYVHNPCLYEEVKVEESIPNFNHDGHIFCSGDQRINRRCHVWNVKAPYEHCSIMVCKVIKVRLGNRWRIVGFLDEHNRRWDKAERYSK